MPQPTRPIRPTFHVPSEDKEALGGTAVRREVTILFTDKPDGPRMDLLLYLPKTAGASKRVPAFLGLNFEGNHTIHSDPGITLSRQWMRNGNKGVVNQQATEASRGTERVAMAGRADPGPRFRPGDRLLRRPRPGLR